MVMTNLPLGGADLRLTGSRAEVLWPGPFFSSTIQLHHSQLPRTYPRSQSPLLISKRQITSMKSDESRASGVGGCGSRQKASSHTWDDH